MATIAEITFRNKKEADRFQFIWNCMYPVPPQYDIKGTMLHTKRMIQRVFK